MEYFNNKTLINVDKLVAHEPDTVFSYLWANDPVGFRAAMKKAYDLDIETDVDVELTAELVETGIIDFDMIDFLKSFKLNLNVIKNTDNIIFA